MKGIRPVSKESTGSQMLPQESVASCLHLIKELAFSAHGYSAYLTAKNVASRSWHPLVVESYRSPA